ASSACSDEQMRTAPTGTSTGRCKEVNIFAAEPMNSARSWILARASYRIATACCGIAHALLSRPTLRILRGLAFRRAPGAASEDLATLDLPRRNTGGRPVRAGPECEM